MSAIVWSIISITIGLVLESSAQAEEPAKIELHIDGDEITWPQIWEAGFRPVHHIGMTTCQQTNVSLSIKFRDASEVFDLGRGDVQMEILKGDAVYQLIFIGRMVLTLDESSERMAAFSRVFGEVLEKAGTPLEALDSYGSVDTSKNIQTSSARFGEYRILHTFNSSFRPETPLLEMVTISLRPKYIRRIGFRTSPIEPPEGYKHISMKPRKLDLGAAKKEQGDLLNEPRKFPPAETRTDAEDAAPGARRVSGFGFSLL